MSIIKKYENLPTTCVSDAMNGLNNLDFSIKPIKEKYRILGRAFTVKLDAGDNLILLKAIRNAKAGEVLIIDARGYTNSAVMGGFIASLAKTLGIGGIVVDGVIRDMEEIQELELALFCKGTTVNASKKYGNGEINVPISCGNAVINPGDIIVGDIDGVICVPKENEEYIMKKASDKLLKDIERSTEIKNDVQLAQKYLDQIINNLHS